MKEFTFVRRLRTLTSERFDVFQKGIDKSIAFCEVHYRSNDEVYLTLIILIEISKELIDQLIKEVDDDMIDLADIEKGNFFIRCYQGKELAGFAIDKEWKRPHF